MLWNNNKKKIKLYIEGGSFIWSMYHCILPNNATETLRSELIKKNYRQYRSLPSVQLDIKSPRQRQYLSFQQQCKYQSQHAYGTYVSRLVSQVSGSGSAKQHQCLAIPIHVMHACSKPSSAFTSLRCVKGPHVPPPPLALACIAMRMRRSGEGEAWQLEIEHGRQRTLRACVHVFAPLRLHAVCYAMKKKQIEADRDRARTKIKRETSEANVVIIRQGRSSPAPHIPASSSSSSSIYLRLRVPR